MRTPPVMTAALLATLLSLSAAAHAAPAPAAKPAAHAVLPWIEDEFTRAVAEAKARKLPLFVESWAPW